MTAATIRGVNAAIAHRNVEMVRGHGYFYFMPLEDAPIDLEIPEIESVYSCHLRDLSKEQWVEHVEDFFQKETT